MTDKPNIAALRIDERLVHGQGQLWIKTLGVNTVIVANDEAANDPIQQTLMKTVIPKTIAMRFFTVQHTCDVIYKASPKQVMFIICKSAEDALKLVEGGVPRIDMAMVIQNRHCFCKIMIQLLCCRSAQQKFFIHKWFHLLFLLLICYFPRFL